MSFFYSPKFRAIFFKLFFRPVRTEAPTKRLKKVPNPSANLLTVTRIRFHDSLSLEPRLSSISLKAGAKIKHFYPYFQIFLQLFSKKITTKSTNNYKTATYKNNFLEPPNGQTAYKGPYSSTAPNHYICCHTPESRSPSKEK